MIYELEKADYPKNPGSLFILDSWAYYYLAGEAGNDDFNTSLVEFLEKEYFPECPKKDYNRNFAFYPGSDDWCYKTEELFARLKLEESGKTYFIYDEKRLDRDWRKSIPEGFRVRRISPELIDSTGNRGKFVDYIKFAWGTVKSTLTRDWVTAP